MKALLFINGAFPKVIPSLDEFDLIACSDGALSKLIKLDFPIERLDFIAGDFDSHCGEHPRLEKDKFIHTPNQNKTDFHKTLEILVKKGVQNLSIYGGSGGEMDHFLGNLTTAHYFKNQLELRFYDEHSEYYFSPKNHQLNDVKGKMISLYPFPTTHNITTKGLHWDLNSEQLSLTSQISTRNYADEDSVTISFEKGDVVLFIGEIYK